MVVVDVVEEEAGDAAGISVFLTKIIFQYFLMQYSKVPEPKGRQKPTQEGQKPGQEEEQEWREGRWRQQEKPFL